MSDTRDDLADRFRKFISDNKDKLCKCTSVSLYLLTNLVQAGVIKEYLWETIDKSSNVNYDKAVTLYNVLANKVDDLPKILGVFKKTGDREAEKILEIFAKTNVTVQVNPYGSSQQVQKQLRTDANTYWTPAPAPAATGPIQLRERPQPANTSRVSQAYSLSAALSPNNIQNAIAAVQEGYTTGAKFKGVALIINVLNFDNDPDSYRHGAQRDTDQLTQVLKTRNFKVYHCPNTTFQVIQETIDKLRLRPFEDEDADAEAFLVAVMSHGDDKEAIYTTDGLPFDIWSDIVKPFNNTNCPWLVGKPKIFILNYCRGAVLHDFGIDPNSEHDALPEQLGPRIPSWSDMLVCYSTVQGHLSYRHTVEGTWFIQALCEVLSQHEDPYDIMALLNVVSELMKTLRSTYGGKQICPYYNIGFTKKFYL